MSLTQRINRLEQSYPRTPKQGFFADNAKLLISVVDQQGNDLYGKLITFTNPYGSTDKTLTRQQLAELKATV
jgi:hypothetical protein